MTDAEALLQALRNLWPLLSPAARQQQAATALRYLLAVTA